MKTQAQRIIDFLREHPGCTSMELTLGLSPFVANPRARISDIRAMPGYDVDCRKRSDGRDGYWLREQPAQLRLDMAS